MTPVGPDIEEDPLLREQEVDEHCGLWFISIGVMGGIHAVKLGIQRIETEPVFRAVDG